MKFPCMNVLALASTAAMIPFAVMAQAPSAQFDGTYAGVLAGSGKSCVGGEKRLKIESGHFTWSYGSSGQRYNDDVQIKPDGSFGRDLSSGSIKGQVSLGQISMTLQIGQCVFKYDAKKAV